MTTHKSQGMTVGEKHIWKKLVIVLGSLKGFHRPGLEQVAFSRSEELTDFALMATEDSPLTVERLMRIGKSPAYKKRREFIEKLEDLQETTVPVVKKMIADYDEDTESPTFEGGYLSLVK